MHREIGHFAPVRNLKAESKGLAREICTMKDGPDAFRHFGVRFPIWLAFLGKSI